MAHQNRLTADGSKLLESRAMMAALSFDSNKFYSFMISGDGHPDPDERGSFIAGFTHSRNQVAANFRGAVFGDTVGFRRAEMVTGEAGGNNAQDDLNAYAARNNYRFIKDDVLPAFDDANSDGDTVDDAVSNFENAAKSVSEAIVDAVDAGKRFVYSAGGGQEVIARAIKLAKNSGVTNAELKDSLRILQHSNWNWQNATSAASRRVTLPYTIKLNDQNGTLGLNTRGGTAGFENNTLGNLFKESLDKQKGGSDDISDYGSHHAASNSTWLNDNWDKTASENAQNELTGEVNYSSATWSNAISAVNKYAV